MGTYTDRPNHSQPQAVSLARLVVSATSAPIASVIGGTRISVRMPWIGPQLEWGPYEDLV